MSAAVTVDEVSMGYLPGHDVVHDVSVAVDAGEILALLGPSGCGKTSLLRAVAGLERVSGGSITIGSTVVTGPATWVKPENRQIGMVFQDGALFPHLSVADNVAFGLRHLDRASARRRIDEVLELVDLPGYGDRLPGTLSGGQQQRVALARSLAPSPSVLLLDEPFSALDAALRVQVRTEVGRILREIGVTTIFVTHDQDEAFVLGDRVAVMRSGRIEQLGTPDALYRHPTTPWVARFVGEANLLTGRLAAGSASTALGPIPVAIASRSGGSQPYDSQPDDGQDDGPGRGVLVLVRPEQIALEAGDGAIVEGVEYYGHDVRYSLLLDDGQTIAARCSAESIHPRGARVALRYGGTSAVAWPDTAPGDAER